MRRPPLEVADLVRAAGEAFIERNRHWLRWKHVKVLRAIRPIASVEEETAHGQYGPGTVNGQAVPG